ncbi:hypothetical protein OS493_017933 [Desmophyllum pertusum]|uniref:Uncharacterized protein n=1 Tax=Desmophyllum pertusum TaxID=174260 RepID=A0A9W9Z020_9CNID|nr:hypothetical protein OS493_017933 [Desmophyllum pertusum]
MGLVRLYSLVKGIDLFAAEAKHHPSCLRSFRTAFANYERSVSRVEKPRDAKQMLEFAAHEKAFASVLEYIKTHVVQQSGVIRLAALRLLYIDELKRNRYENLNYRAEKLLKRLQNDPITNKVLFTKVDQGRADAITFWLVYSANMTVSDALSGAYSLGSTDKYQDVSLVLRGGILKAHRECTELPWPPTADDMKLNAANLLPADLIRFLSLLISGKEENETSEKVVHLKVNVLVVIYIPHLLRYLVWLELFLINLERTHPGAKELLTKGAIAVARSMIPGALSAVDKTMEETFMRFAKSSGGFSGLYSKFGAYQKWCRTTSARAQFYERTLEMVDLITDPDNPRTGRHRELEKAEITKSEQAILRVIDAVKNFTDPFTIVAKDRLYCLASGAPVPLDAEADVLRAETVGKAAKSDFI